MKELADLVIALAGASSVMVALYLTLRGRVIKLVTTAMSRRKSLPLAAPISLHGPRYTITRTAIPKWSDRTSTHVLILLILILSVANLLVLEDRIWVGGPVGHPSVSTFDVEVTETTNSHVVLSGDVGTVLGDGKFKVLLLASCKAGGDGAPLNLIYVAGHGSAAAPVRYDTGGGTLIDTTQINTSIPQGKRALGHSGGWVVMGTAGVSRDGTFTATIPRGEHNLDIVAVVVPSGIASSGWVQSVYDLNPVARSDVIRVAAAVPNRATGNILTRP